MRRYQYLPEDRKVTESTSIDIIAVFCSLSSMQKKLARSFAVVVALFLTFAVHAAEEDTFPPYQRARVVKSRFGGKERQDLIQKVVELPKLVGKHVVGQDDMAMAIQSRLLQYLNSLGTRQAEPVAIHLIGLFGVGKTSTVKVMEDMGLPVFKIDAPKYPGGDQAANSEYQLSAVIARALAGRASPDSPLVFFIDELDKVAEIDKEGKEIIQPVINTLNTILSEGRAHDFNNPGKPHNFSNVFVMTAGNFSPALLSQFSESILKEKKDYWDFTPEDLAKFDDWVRSGKNSLASVARLLSGMYRANTVGRLIADTVVAKVLNNDDFDEIVAMAGEEVKARLTGQATSALKLNYTPAFIDFLRSVTVYAPGGARVPIKGVDLLVEQLISMSVHADLGDPSSLALPRTISIDYDEGAEEAIVHVQAYKRVGTKRVLAAEEKIRVKYNRVARTFQISPELLKPLPAQFGPQVDKLMEKDAKKRLSSAKITAARQSLRSDGSLEKHLNLLVADQKDLAADLDEMLHLYMNAQSTDVRYLTVPGFTGTGKTMSFTVAAKKLRIPIVKLNMQDYSGESQDSADRFGEDLFNRLAAAREEYKTDKVILLIEELDKAYEIDPSNGLPITRPALGHLKDLLNDGTKMITIKTSFGSTQKLVDVRGVFIGMTTNFPTARFNLKADPRETTIEDMQAFETKVFSSPKAVRKMLTSLFRDDTVNRLMSGRISRSHTLSHSGYMQIISQQPVYALSNINSNSFVPGQNAAFSVAITDDYLNQYLAAESIIPSEGGRQAAATAQMLLKRDLIHAIKNLPKNSPLYKLPVQIVLDYEPRDAKNPPRVIPSARLSDARDIQRFGSALNAPLPEIPRKLIFPPRKTYGRLLPVQLYVAGHEFGHALAATMFGNRFESIRTAPLEPGESGFVKTLSCGLSTTARVITGELLSTLASRSMERIMLAKNPKDAASVLAIGAGSSQDNMDATRTLWRLVYALGMDPSGGTIERSGLGGCSQDDYAKRRYFFEELPNEKIEALAQVARDLENHLVEVFLQARSPEWFKEKITKLALAGEMSEAEFYALIGQPYPGRGNTFLGERSGLHDFFAGKLDAESKAIDKAKSTAHGDGANPVENMDAAIEVLRLSLEKHLHSCLDDLKSN